MPQATLEDCLTELKHEVLHEIRSAGLEPAPLLDSTSSKPVFLDFTIRCCLLEFDKKGDKMLWSENLSNDVHGTFYNDLCLIFSRVIFLVPLAWDSVL